MNSNQRKNMEAAGERVFQDVFVRREGARLTPQMDAEPVRFTKSRLPVLAFALAALVLILVAVPFRPLNRQPEGEVIRASADANKVFNLADGSRVEMRAGSELSIERAADGVRLHLNQGKVIVNAAKQRNGHLYVQTRDLTVSVVGTVFFVTTEETGSGVGVLEGLVAVSHGKESIKLRAGEEFSTPPPSRSAVLFEEVSWSRYAEEHRALLQQAPEKSAALSPARQNTGASRTGFGVISIRRNKSGSPENGGSGGSFGDGWPGRFRSTNVPIGDLLRYAYHIEDFQLFGAPSWLDSERYDIEATLENSAKRGDMEPLIQALLENRFKLKAHGEAKETLVYFLVPAKGGLKLKPGIPCTPQPVAGQDFSKVCGALAGGAFSIDGTSTTVTDLSDELSSQLKRRVLDKTGYTAHFDVHLEFRPEAAGAETTFPNSPSIFASLEEKLGLKLESGKALIDSVVIDHIERPSEN